MAFWTYMLHCRGGYFYVGHTDNLERRVAEHESGRIAGFASDHRPVALVWSENFPTRLQALEAEKRIKGWSRAKKMALIRGDWAKVSDLAKGKASPSTSSGRTVPSQDVPQTSHAWRADVRRLSCHPMTPAGRVVAVSASVLRNTEGFELTYAVACEAGALQVAPTAPPDRADGLWQTTCFELFVKTGALAYREYNFSPSTRWAAYEFSDYRQGMAPVADARPPVIRTTQAATEFQMMVNVPLDGFTDMQIALSAVIEEADGSKSYWALNHPAGKPDFHHADCFALTLGAPAAA